MQLGKYRLIRKLGKGGMGEVWEGMLDGERGFERRVAIKCMAAGGEAWEQRFLDEARIASRLHHANIVSVLDFGVSGETWYQVLELIDGIDAHHLMDKCFDIKGPMPVGLALHICAEVAHGLSAAHAAMDEAGLPLSIVHRDVSLDNVLVSWQGDVKLGDFGVAKARDRSHRTMAGATVGKVSYMAPEQATGAQVDGRTDLFALGCALHALLTRRTPLADESSLMELLAGKPLPLAYELPVDVAAIIARSVERSRGDRYQSAAEMAEALAQARHRYLNEDPRMALAKFLVPFKPPQTPMRVGMLDGLLAPPSPGTVTGGVPTVGTPSPNDALTATGPMARVMVAKTKASPWFRGRSRAVLVAALTFVAVTGAGTLVWAPWRTATVESPVPPPVVARAPDPTPEPAPVPPPTVTPTEPVAEAPIAAVRPSATHPKGGTKHAAGQGVLAIGGAKAQRAEILVDGHSQGFAPKRLELSCGSHDVTLVTPGGDRIGPHRIEVTQTNTDLEPLRSIVE